MQRKIVNHAFVSTRDGKMPKAYFHWPVIVLIPLTNEYHPIQCIVRRKPNMSRGNSQICIAYGSP